jgi:uncharacterized protein (DUF2147 family)
MKKTILSILSALALIVISSSFRYADNPDAIVGFWKTGDGKGVVQIFKQGNQFFGKIIWLQEPNDANGKPKVDDKNDDPKLKGRPLIGLVNLRDFTFIKENLWKEGKVYDPKNGHDYSCKITMKDNNTIEVRGYIGISLIGRTDVWKRTAVK